jgi:hypothetical protein
LDAKWDRIRFFDVFWWPVYRYRFRCYHQLSLHLTKINGLHGQWNVNIGKWRGRGRKKRTRTIRRSNNLFELSLHPANKYFPSVSNSTDVISPKQSASVCTHIPPIASHNLICLSFPLLHQYLLSTLRGRTPKLRVFLCCHNQQLELIVYVLRTS